MSNFINTSSICNGTKSNNYLRFSMSATMSIDILSQETREKQVMLQAIYVSLSTIQFLIATIGNLLAIGTCLKKKIRITSLGVYLIVFFLASLTGIGLLYFRIITTLFFNEQLGRNSLIHCRVLTTVLNSTLILCLWTGALISVERVLLQCFTYNLYRSRKYAFGVSVILLLFTAAANVSTFVGWIGAPHPIVSGMYSCKFRQFPARWKLADEIVNSMYIHFVTPWLLHVVSIVCVLIHIIRRKMSLTDVQKSQRKKLILQQLKKHKDFFLPPIFILTCTLPHVLLTNLAGSNKQHTCLDSNKHIYLRLHLALDYLYYSLQTIGFFTYIYPSKVYMHQFHEIWTMRKKRARCEP